MNELANISWNENTIRACKVLKIGRDFNGKLEKLNIHREEEGERERGSEKE